MELMICQFCQKARTSLYAIFQSQELENQTFTTELCSSLTVSERGIYPHDITKLDNVIYSKEPHFKGFRALCKFMQ